MGVIFTIKFNKIKDWGNRIDAGLFEGMKKIGFEIERTMRQIAPIDTGTLRRSVESKAYRQGTEIGVYITPRVNYAGYVDRPGGLGPRSLASGAVRPFSKPSFDRNKSKIMPILKQEVRRF